MNDPEEDSPFPEESQVMVRYPLTPEQEKGPREAWSWLPGTVEQVCGPDEWQVCVELDDVAFEENGERMFPLCFRDASEIRPANEAEPSQEAQA
jgi:hypothetical protein